MLNERIEASRIPTLDERARNLDQRSHHGHDDDAGFQHPSATDRDHLARIVTGSDLAKSAHGRGISPVNGQIQYGLFRPMTSAPTPAASNLDLPLSLALEERQALEDVLALAEAIAHDNLPVVATREPLPAGDICHFATPVRFGRRRTDQFGHLELTNAWLTFRAALDVSVSWSEVAHVHCAGREVEITLVDSTRLLRFWCPCLSDAARACVLAEHLASVARQRAIITDTACHAWV